MVKYLFFCMLLSLNLYAADAPQTTDAKWQGDVLNSKGVVVVDFNAGWCSPCRKMSPIMDKIFSETHANMFKLNVDINNCTSDKYGVHNIPCFIIFKDGVEVKRRYGSCSEETMKEFIKN